MQQRARHVMALRCWKVLLPLPHARRQGMPQSRAA
jgi:hypothetical protein